MRTFMVQGFHMGVAPPTASQYDSLFAWCQRPVDYVRMLVISLSLSSSVSLTLSLSLTLFLFMTVSGLNCGTTLSDHKHTASRHRAKSDQSRTRSSLGSVTRCERNVQTVNLSLNLSRIFTTPVMSQFTPVVNKTEDDRTSGVEARSGYQLERQGQSSLLFCHGPFRAKLSARTFATSASTLFRAHLKSFSRSCFPKVNSHKKQTYDNSLNLDRNIIARSTYLSGR